MRDIETWRPTKFAFQGGRVDVGPEASAASWLITKLVADAYSRHLPAHARGRLVDLGCGTVPLYAAYRERVTDVTCVDLAVGESRYAARHLDIAHDLNQPLPLADASYDTVVLSDVLEHIRKPEALIAETSRILAPGGKLLLNVPFFYWLHAQPYDFFRYSEHALRSFMEQASLRVVTLEVLGSAPEVLADIVGKHLGQLPKLGPSLAKFLQRAAWSACRQSSLAHALAPSSQRFPLAYFLVAERPRQVDPRG